MSLKNKSISFLKNLYDEVKGDMKQSINRYKLPIDFDKNTIDNICIYLENNDFIRRSAMHKIAITSNGIEEVGKNLEIPSEYFPPPKYLRRKDEEWGE